MKDIGFLFDLDGVILDTEPQYNIFWGGQFLKKYPGQPELHRAIKGQTLIEIFNRFFPDKEEQMRITDELNLFEKDMPMPWVAGFPEFAKEIQSAGYRSYIVTSSNQPKMDSVIRQHPDLLHLVTGMVTSEDFNESKPSPECYIKGAELLRIESSRCVAFEDSINGLTSARDAQVKVVALATSLTVEKIQSLNLADFIIHDFTELTLKNLLNSLQIQ